VGRSKRRWIDGVVEGLRKLGARSWWTVARDRQSWKETVQQAVTCRGL
jgi:hypothetical protein